MKAIQKIDSIRRQAWLVGIGVVDTGRELAADKLDEIFVDSSTFIHQLLTKGESLDAQLQTKLRGRKMIDDKIAFLREKLGMRNVSRDQHLEDLSSKVDALIDVVAKLALQKETAKPVVKLATKPAAKSAAKSTVKPAAKSAAKPAAKPTAKGVASKTATKPVGTKIDQ